MRYWRPEVAGRQALVIGYPRRAVDFCTDFRVVAHVSTPPGSDERGEPIARCTLPNSLAGVWPRVVATSN
jgi:hypothetical protein